jgi:DNA polymerase-3 subunit alpha
MKLVIDTETTGLLRSHKDFIGQPGICQIGALKLADDDTVLSSLNVLVNPEGVKWEEGAMKTHGITPEHVKDAPTFFEIAPLLAGFVMGCDTWIGFNTPFDKDVLYWQLMRYGFEKNFPWPVHDIDVMVLAGRHMEMEGKRGLKMPKLQEAYEFLFGKRFDGAHDALADVQATADIWKALRDRT